jgi:hypothetical protein
MYDELIQTYPPMNGPDAPANELIENDPALEARLTDYSIGSNLIYAAFAWSQAINAKSVFLQVANKHGVAVAAISDDGRITRPDAANQPRKTFWRRK